MCSKSKKRTKRGPAMSKHEPSSLVKKAFIHVSVTDKNKESKEKKMNEKKKKEQKLFSYYLFRLLHPITMVVHGTKIELCSCILAVQC